MILFIYFRIIVWRLQKYRIQSSYSTMPRYHAHKIALFSTKFIDFLETRMAVGSRHLLSVCRVAWNTIFTTESIGENKRQSIIRRSKTAAVKNFPPHQLAVKNQNPSEPSTLGRFVISRLCGSRKSPRRNQLRPRRRPLCFKQRRSGRRRVTSLTQC